MDISQVTLTQMRYAIAVLETKNFKRAAAQCHVSQSGLSMQLQKLEDLLGFVLFDRSHKPVLVTFEGQALTAQMKSILREVERLAQLTLESNEPAGPFRLGVIPSLSPTVLPLLLADFNAKFPRVTLLVEELKTEDMIACLQSDTLDAGIAATPLNVRGLEEQFLGAEPLFAYLPFGDPLLKKKQISQAALRGRQLWVMPEGHCFRSQVLSFCRTETVAHSGPIQFESGSFQTLVRLVDEGLGATILPALVVMGLTEQKQKLQVRPFVTPTPLREIGLVTARSDLRRRVNDALVLILRAKLKLALGTAPRSGVTLSPLAKPHVDG